MIYILIPVHNRIQFTIDCLRSLQAQTFRDFKIILIDDGSTDGTSSQIRQEFPDTLILTGDGALWWSASINLGLEAIKNILSPNDLVLTLNNDLIVEPGYLQSFLTAHAKFPYAAIGSVSVDIENPRLIFDGGVRINPWTAKYTWPNKGRLLSDVRNGQDVYVEVTTLSGRGTLFPASVCMRTGSFDQKRFPQYWADYNFAVRAKKEGTQLYMSYQNVVHSHVQHTGLSPKSKRNPLHYFFGIKSPGRMQTRIAFARTLIDDPFQRITFILFDITRSIVRFLFPNR